MKQDTKHKLKASLCLIGTFLLAMCVSEVVFLLGICHPLLGGELKGVAFWLFLAWLYGSLYVWYRWSKRKTTWWQALEGKSAAAQKGGVE